MATRLRAAQDLQERLNRVVVPEGVDVADMREYYRDIDYSGAGPKPASDAPSTIRFEEAGEFVQHIRDLAKAGREEMAAKDS